MSPNFYVKILSFFILINSGLISEQVSNPKWLRGGVIFVNKIPKNASGKILRRDLRQMLKIFKSKL